MKTSNHAFTCSFLNLRCLIAAIMTLLVMPVLSGCYYYKVRTYTVPVQSKRAAKLLSGKKYFILHQNTAVWHLKEGSVDFDGKDLEGTKELLDSNHLYYMSVDKMHKNRFRPAKRLKRLEEEQIVPDEPVYEVHIYVSEHMGDVGDDIVVPLSAIRKIEVFDLAKGATMSSHVLPFLLSGVAILGAVIVIVADDFTIY